MRRWVKSSLIGCAALILFALTGCVTPSTAPVGTECLVFQPIEYDSREIPGELAARLKLHNLRWLELCDE